MSISILLHLAVANNAPWAVPRPLIQESGTILKFSLVIINSLANTARYNKKNNNGLRNNKKWTREP